MCRCGNNCSRNCCTTITRYQGADIDCVGINTLDPLDEVVRKLSEYVCGIDGTDGTDGEDGEDGVGVASITYNTFTGQLTVNLTDGSNFTSGDLRGQGVDHVSYTSTTGTAQGQPGETDTYTFWGDALETINLGTFTITNGNKYTVGQTAQGGTIAYVDPTGQHGLVVYKEDLGTQRWHNNALPATVTMANSDGIFGGLSNNQQIIATLLIGDGGQYAARSVNELVGDTYGDWYLPSKEELDIMYNNKAVVNAGSLSLLGEVLNEAVLYWASTEFDMNNSWAQSMGTGVQTSELKNQTLRVRPVRKF